MRVTHPTYGEGTIISDNGSNTTVDFDNHGKKTVPTSELTKFIFG